MPNDNTAELLLLTIFEVHVTIPLVALAVEHSSTVRNIAQARPARAGESSELDILPCESQHVYAQEAQRKRY
jgi:hypothetical protein